MYKIESGQALVESTLFFTVLMLLLLSFHHDLLPATNKAQQQLAQARADIWSLKQPPKSQNSESYAFNRAAGVVIRPINTLSSRDAKLSLKNLRQVTDKQRVGRFAMARLTDDWGVIRLADLRQRPSGWVPSKALSSGFFSKVQYVISLLPFADEFRASSLKWGWIDPNVVPE
ncbi:hypothetical protein CWI84_05410 [Idiomarina tyrosinivorans]|uniref:Uncharacterized protein n=1 Tax=Idiomarina tyrosinivorans TaxID=1445662 RepID=A0A432ZRE5_9GAMM|nr:hypothetical protein [Idiomarina tyrosinivorans]RUO80495.1 hypothetical protein CWI84_05410 [Idiomarina tyrosinivorans]